MEIRGKNVMTAAVTKWTNKDVHDDRRSPWFCMWVVLQPPRIFDISSGRRQVNPGRLPGEGKFHHDGTKDGTASSKQASN